MTNTTDARNGTERVQIYSGADWLVANKKAVSPFGAQVANLVGHVFRGIYHIDGAALNADWSDTRWVHLIISHRSLATWDGDELTGLVLMCHEAAIRLDIEAATVRRLRLTFHPRKREGSTWERHPDIQQAIARWTPEAAR